MSFRINTNIAAMNAHANSQITDRELTSSLGRLSSGLRIQTAADDASGLVIADSLKSQASSLGQAISNGNDAIDIVQTADKAMAVLMVIQAVMNFKLLLKQYCRQMVTKL